MFKYFIVLFLSINCFSQTKIKGRIEDINTKLPLEYASLFVSNTTFKTLSNNKGEFEIEVPNSNYELVISYVGYESIILNSKHIVQNNKLNIIQLEKSIEELSEVSILSKRIKAAYLKMFIDNFIGTSKNASKTKILNYEDLNFQPLDNDNFAVTASKPIEIENENLNYHISFLLTEFKINRNENTCYYSGYPSFTDLKTDKKINITKISKKRNETYEGSILHFIRSLYANKFEEEGFIINSFSMTLNPKYEETNFVNINKLNVNRIPKFIYKKIKDNIKKEEIVIEENNKQFLLFTDYLEIVYTKKREDTKYLSNFGKSPNGNQTSQIKCIEKIELFENGNFYNSQKLNFYGYMGWKNVADMLPFDFKYEK